VDGALSRNLPASDARDLGADIVICSDVTEPLDSADELRSMVDVLSQLEGAKPRAEAIPTPSTSQSTVEAPAPAPKREEPKREPPAPKKEVATRGEAAAKPPVATSGPTQQGAFAVQLVALRERGEAEAIVSRLVGKGYPAYVLVPSPGAPPVYRVQVGRFKSRGDAEKTASRLKKEEQFNPWVTR